MQAEVFVLATVQMAVYLIVNFKLGFYSNLLSLIL